MVGTSTFYKYEYLYSKVGEVAALWDRTRNLEQPVRLTVKMILNCLHTFTGAQEMFHIFGYGAGACTYAVVMGARAGATGMPCAGPCGCWGGYMAVAAAAG